MWIILIFLIIVLTIIISNEIALKSKNQIMVNTKKADNIWVKNAITCAELQDKSWKALNKNYIENKFNFISLNLILTRKLLENFNNLNVELEKEEIDISYKNYLYLTCTDCDEVYNEYLLKLETYNKYLEEERQKISKNEAIISAEYRLALNFFYIDKPIAVEDEIIKESCKTIIKILVDNINKIYLINYKI